MGCQYFLLGTRERLVDCRLTELGSRVDPQAFLDACVQIRELARLLEGGYLTETAVLKSLVDLSLQLVVGSRCVHQVVEERAEGDGSCVAAGEKSTERLLLDIAPSEVDLLTLFLVDLEDLVCHVLPLRRDTPVKALLHETR